jgi:hypothetical protein
MPRESEMTEITNGSINENKVIINSMLGYIVFSLQSGTIENIKNAVLGYCTDEDIIEAKDIKFCWAHCDTNAIGDKPRRVD